jgi:peptidyl-dipeptidase A
MIFEVVSMSNAGQKLSAQQPPTVAEAEEFLKNAEARLLELSVTAGRADWVKATYITDDTEILAAQADERAIAAQVELAKQATRFDGLTLPADVARKMQILKTSLVLPTPADPRLSQELTEIASRM